MATLVAEMLCVCATGASVDSGTVDPSPHCPGLQLAATVVGVRVTAIPGIGHALNSATAHDD